MNILKTADFDHAFAKLPKEIQRLVRQQEERFQENPYDPRLHIKKVRGLPIDYSLRVTRSYRVLFYQRDVQTSVWYKIDHRKDVYR
jgi:mRNA-degrading endonuclease RelE of RelBE toxin-antitoxin system